MKVIKKINNNVAVCIDNDGHELIAFGKGIGFPKIPYELTDLNKIWRTYYGINPSYLGLLNEISEDVFALSIKITDQAKMRIMNEINSNIVFTLADHINFAIDRYKKNMDIKMPFVYDIQYLYENEMYIGEFAVKLINKEMNVHLSKDEAVSIALHFINAENMQRNETDEVNEKQIINDLTNMIEEDFAIHIDKEGFNYSRFVSHLQYLLKRREEDTAIASENKKMYDYI
ncbi:PRD domain-containing protein [[Clostridium] innocuum]|nr:PRD domain-containing protein [[Clostridium] innocuum]